MPSVARMRKESRWGRSLRCKTSGLEVQPMVAATASPNDLDKHSPAAFEHPASGSASESAATSPLQWHGMASRIQGMRYQNETPLVDVMANQK